MINTVFRLVSPRRFEIAFEDIDMLDEVKNYYKEVFNITLTDEQVNKIFNPSVNAGAGFANGK